MVRVKFRAPDRQNRAMGSSEHGFGHAAVESVRQAPTTMGPHDDEVGRSGPSRFKNGIIRKATAKEIVGRHLSGRQRRHQTAES